MIKIMAKYADVVNFVPQPDPESYAETLRRLERACTDTGRDPERVRKSHFITMLVGADDA
jgi:alkanesulfonate monooxygenase SsuD/methylene tetrahydromethanopterin reductase-like flavin-dependent oxidoreductase (luciferase family)